MQNPFPGMNPYLEHPDYWSDFHNRFIVALADDLSNRLDPKYRVVTDKRVYKVGTTLAIGRPDVSVQQRRNPAKAIATVSLSETSIQPIPVAVPMLEEVSESYLEVRDAATKEVVSAIELLSPANKRGEGRQKYVAKRQQIFESATHLLEIDLLRGGEALPVRSSVREEATHGHYRILVSRASTRPLADLYPFDLGDRIPVVPLPLRPEDPEPEIDLQALANGVYERSRLGSFIDYTERPPIPWTMGEVAPFIPQDL